MGGDGIACFSQTSGHGIGESLLIKIFYGKGKIKAYLVVLGEGNGHELFF